MTRDNTLNGEDTVTDFADAQREKLNVRGRVVEP